MSIDEYGRPTEPTRRGVLVALAAVVLAGLGAVVFRPRRATGWRRTVRELAIATGLLEPAATSGARYLASHPEEADVEKLLRHLVPARGPVDVANLRAALAERIDRELADRELVSVGGWMVSRSEGRFLALVSLL